MSKIEELRNQADEIVRLMAAGNHSDEAHERHLKEARERLKAFLNNVYNGLVRSDEIDFDVFVERVFSEEGGQG